MVTGGFKGQGHDSAALLDGAEYHKGSWWPRWESWLNERSGGQTKGHIPGANDTNHCARWKGDQSDSNR